MLKKNSLEALSINIRFRSKKIILRGSKQILKKGSYNEFYSKQVFHAENKKKRQSLKCENYPQLLNLYKVQNTIQQIYNVSQQTNTLYFYILSLKKLSDLSMHHFSFLTKCNLLNMYIPQFIFLLAANVVFHTEVKKVPHKKSKKFSKLESRNQQPSGN